MKMKYRVVGVIGVGNDIKLKLKPEELVKEKFSTMDAVKDIGKFIDNMKNEAVKTKDRDSLTIPYDIWKQRNYQVEDIVEVEIN